MGAQAHPSRNCRESNGKKREAGKTSVSHGRRFRKLSGRLKWMTGCAGWSRELRSTP